jgi:hypothetical protein
MKEPELFERLEVKFEALQNQQIHNFGYTVKNQDWSTRSMKICKKPYVMDLKMATPQSNQRIIGNIKNKLEITSSDEEHKFKEFSIRKDKKKRNSDKIVRNSNLWTKKD